MRINNRNSWLLSQCSAMVEYGSLQVPMPLLSALQGHTYSRLHGWTNWTRSIGVILSGIWTNDKIIESGSVKSKGNPGTCVSMGRGTINSEGNAVWSKAMALNHTLVMYVNSFLGRILYKQCQLLTCSIFILVVLLNGAAILLGSL